MNIDKLAKKNDKTLVIAVNRWMLGGRRDPIPDILILSKLVKLGLIQILTLILMLFWMSFFWHRFKGSIAIGSVVMLFVISSLAFWRNIVLRKRLSDEKNAKQFRDAIYFIEDLGREGEWAEEQWGDGHFLDMTNSVVNKYFHDTAKRIMELEKIPWRKGDADKLRKEFNEKLDLLSDIALVSSDRRDYFESKSMSSELAVTV